MRQRTVHLGPPVAGRFQVDRGNQESTRFLPDRLAVYSAESAAFNKKPLSYPQISVDATPMDAVTASDCPASNKLTASSEARIASARDTPLSNGQSGRMMISSSPPNLQAMSLAPSVRNNSAATTRRTVSPAA
jgi:hypothetical protein